MSSAETQVVQGTAVPATSQPPVASTVLPPNQPQASTAAAQLAVTYQLPAQPAQQPTQFVMAQPATQPPVHVAPAVQPVMLVQGSQFQQQPMAMGVPVPQQVPQPVQYVQQPLASGSVGFTAQPQSGMPQVVMNPGYFNQPNFNYTPSSYFIFTLVMAILCGVFSPLTLFCSVPAVFISLKSKSSSTAGNIKQARREGLIAIGLTIAAILFALILAIVFTGVFVALGRTIQCNNYYNRNRYYYGYPYYYYSSYRC